MKFSSNRDSKKASKVSMVMDSRAAHSPEARTKLDCINPIENALWSENSGNGQHRSRCDLRKSLAWDSAFFTSPGVLDVEELFASLNLREKDIELDVKSKCTNGAFPSTLDESDDGRRSLAWNSAFFTDPGVLNAEELFLVNGGISKTRDQGFPETKKQLWKSVDSGLTAQGSRYSVTSIERDLFDDLGAASRGSTIEHDARSTNGGVREIQFLKESNAASAHKKPKPRPPPGRQRSSEHRQKKTQKEPSRLSPQPKGVVCSGESTPSPCQKSDKFMCGSGVAVAVYMNKSLSPLELGKLKNTSVGCKTGRNTSTLKNRFSEGQARSAPTVTSSHTTGWRRVVDSRLTASDSSFKSPSRFALDSGVSEKRRKTPNKPTTTLSNISVKDVRSSGLRLPLPKIGFFDSDNSEKENREPNLIAHAESASRRRYRKLPQNASPDERPSPLGRRNPTTLSVNANAICSKTERKKETATKRTDRKTQRNRNVAVEL